MDLVQTIKDFRSINQPLLIWGPPGVGKSQMVKQAAGKDTVIDLRLSMLDPVDLRGMPMVNRSDECEATVTWAAADFIEEANHITKRGEKCILFLDEINTGAPSVQNAALQLVLDRRCGPHRLNDGCCIVAACNKASHKAHVNQISAPLRNRFTIVDIEPNLELWTKWAFANNIMDTVIGFLQWNPAALYQPSKDEHTAFPTPRSWETASHLLQTICTEDTTSAYLTGTVGHAAAGEFAAYVDEIQFMPDVDKLIAGTETYAHNRSKPSITYAIIVSMVYKTVRDLKLVDKAAVVANELGAEFESLFFANLIQGSKEADKVKLITNKSVKTWSQRNGYQRSTALVF